MMLKDSTRRAVRTLVQLIPTAALVILTAVPVIQSFIPPEDPARPRVWGYVAAGCSALVIAATVVVKVWNALEAKFGWNWLKQPPATPANPDPEGPA